MMVHLVVAAVAVVVEQVVAVGVEVEVAVVQVLLVQETAVVA